MLQEVHEKNKRQHLPCPADHTALDAAEDKVGIWGCKDTLGHVELLIKQHSQVLLLSVALNPFSIQSVFVLGTAPTQVQDLTFAFNKYSTAQGKKIRKEGNVSKINMDLIYQLPPQAKQTQPGESKFNLLPIKTNLEW